MQIKNLLGLNIQEILECFQKAFQNYFVPIPTDPEYWNNRFKAARIDFSNSFGVFVNNQLVAFVLNGIDIHENVKTAYNTGTGVLPKYRGRHLVDKIYQYAFKEFRKQGVEKCLLEVIQENEVAIKVYERIGFVKTRNLLSYGGDLQISDKETSIEKIEFEDFLSERRNLRNYYTWDFMDEALILGKDWYNAYLVRTETKQVGYFAINPKSGTLAQYELIEGNYPELFAGVSQINGSIRVINVDDRQKDLIMALQTCGLSNSINQYEMETLLV